jgi:hypothetical protein
MLECCPVDKLSDRNLNGKNKDKHQFQKNGLAILLGWPEEFLDLL